ncbi:MAG: aldehyde dehydrogenase family protein [Pseudomonadota bacterium]
MWAETWSSAFHDGILQRIDVFRFFAGAARTMASSAVGEYAAEQTFMIRRDPIGPVAAIALWNDALMMTALKLAAPIAAGCPVMLKPSEIMPLSRLRLAQLLRDVC